MNDRPMNSEQRILKSDSILVLPQQFDISAHSGTQMVSNISIWYCPFPEEETAQEALTEKYQPLLPETLLTASTGRKMEFIAGRRAAQAALEHLGLTKTQVLSNPDRSPAWPEGTKGSITHKKNCAVAAASAKLDFLGIDLESPMSEKMAHKLSRKIIDDTEKQLLLDSHIPFADAFTRVFSAKEALYKAIYPDIRRYLGFNVCQVSAIETDKLTLTLQTELQDELQHHRPFEICSFSLKTQILSVLLDNR